MEERVKSNFSFSHNIFKSCLLLMRQHEYLWSKGLIFFFYIYNFQVYDLDGTVHKSKAFVLDLYDKALQRFKADYPEFTDLRIIMTSLRY